MKHFFLLSILNIFFINNSFNALFNEAVENYYKNNFTVSSDLFEKILETNDKKLKASAYFFIGNIKFKEEKYLEAIANYKNALRLNSEIYEAKYNLVLARNKLNEIEKKQNSINNNSEVQNDEPQKNGFKNEVLNEAKQLENNAMKNLNSTNKKQNSEMKNW